MSFVQEALCPLAEHGEVVYFQNEMRTLVRHMSEEGCHSSVEHQRQNGGRTVFSFTF